MVDNCVGQLERRGNMERLRKKTYSVYFFIKDMLHRNGFNTIRDEDQANLYRDEFPAFVRVTYGFDDVGLNDTDLPTIVIEHDYGLNNGLQIGGGWWDRQGYVVDIFASSNVERDDLACILFEAFNDRSTNLLDYDIGWPGYTYASGDTYIKEYYPSGTPPAMSDMYFEDVIIDTLPRTGTIGEVDNHRAFVSFTAVTLR